MTEELFDIVFNYIYMPFGGALAITAGFFWRLREKDKEQTLDEIESIDGRLNNAISHNEAKEMIDDRCDQINHAYIEQLTVLKDIRKNTATTDVFLARIDERLKSLEAKSVS